MKKIIFPVILFLLLSSTFINKPNNFGYGNSSEENKEATINKLEKEEYFSGNRNNDLFFNLSFGMSVPEVQKTFVNLQKEQILENIESKYGILAASYTMNYHEYSNVGRIYCFFNDNRLNEIQIDTLNQNNSNLLDLFIKKYGECDYLAENIDKDEYHWIKGNRHLTIFSFHDSERLLIQYIDTTEKIKNRNINLFKQWSSSALA